MRDSGSVESVERQGDDLKQEAAPHCTYEPGGLKWLRAVRSVTAVTGGTVCRQASGVLRDVNRS